MRAPRLTLRTMMIIVLMVALNAGAVRFCFRMADERSALIVGLLGAFNVLAATIARRLTKERAPASRQAFWDGFTLVGAASFLHFCIPFLPLFSEPLREVINWLGTVSTRLFSPIETVVGSTPHLIWYPVLFVIMLIFINIWFSGPVLIAAFVGGKILQHWSENAHSNGNAKRDLAGISAGHTSIDQPPVP